MKKITTESGHVLNRRSRWIPIRHNYRPSRRNSLWYYVTDGNGYREGQTGFDPSSGLNLDYFVWNGRKWAIEQFYSVWGTMGIMPMVWHESDGDHAISGYDAENYFSPILIELDEYGENVRVYEEE